MISTPDRHFLFSHCFALVPSLVSPCLVTMVQPKITLLPTADDQDAMVDEVMFRLTSDFGLLDIEIQEGQEEVAYDSYARVKDLIDKIGSKPEVWVLLGPSKLQSILEAQASVSVYCATSNQSPAVIASEINKLWQKKLVEVAQLRTSSPKYVQAIAKCCDEGLQITGNMAVGEIRPIQGKVRDRYEGTSKLALVTTDRQSGFDRMLALVPFKGAVLNLTSAYWFERTKHIIPNHLLTVPHPNVSIVKKCKPFPIEFVVRYVLE